MLVNSSSDNTKSASRFVTLLVTCANVPKVATALQQQYDCGRLRRQDDARPKIRTGHWHCGLSTMANSVPLPRFFESQSMAKHPNTCKLLLSRADDNRIPLADKSNRKQTRP